MTEEISLYIHLPFCRKKCPYCSFFVLPYTLEAETLLLEALLKHLDHYRPQFEGKKIVSVYFGGGTPSLVLLKTLATLIDAIRQLPGTFADDCEWTLEANPEDIHKNNAVAYADLGINRVSLGAQSFIQEELHFLGRKGSKKTILSAIEAFVDATITNISIDLMFELMDQTLKNFQKTLAEVQHLPITHLSLYNLLIEEGSSFHKRKNLLESRRPDPEIGTQMLKEAIQSLESYGFERYEISAFAKPGFRSRHNMGYWTMRPFIGLGPSAWSFFEGTRSQCFKNLKKYHENLFSNQSPIEFQETLPLHAQEKEAFSLQLRLKEGVEKHKFPIQLKACHPFLQKGWMEETSTHIRLTSEGQLFYDSIQIDFI